mmetsp:Transcript_21661/g.82432  ORF Transcript_21661/g.82432 Transcript_21661/m.82432 type:complete len:259 (-) Transcript_21661:211-987(-)
MSGAGQREQRGNLGRRRAEPTIAQGRLQAPPPNRGGQPHVRSPRFAPEQRAESRALRRGRRVRQAARTCRGELAWVHGDVVGSCCDSPCSNQRGFDRRAGSAHHRRCLRCLPRPPCIARRLLNSQGRGVRVRSRLRKPLRDALRSNKLHGEALLLFARCWAKSTVASCHHSGWCPSGSSSLRECPHRILLNLVKNVDSRGGRRGRPEAVPPRLSELGRSSALACKRGIHSQLVAASDAHAANRCPKRRRPGVERRRQA